MPRTAALVCCSIVTVGVLAGCRAAPSTPLARAAVAGDLPLLERLVRQTAPDVTDQGWTPLIWSVRAGQEPSVTALLAAGADPNWRDRRGWTPLMHALHRGQPGLARLLMDRGADPSAGSSGNSPLEMAALDGEVELVRRILAVNPPADQRLRALRLALTGGALADVDRPVLGECRPDVVRVLTESQPDGHLPEEVGWLRYLRDCRGFAGVGSQKFAAQPPRGMAARSPDVIK